MLDKIKGCMEKYEMEYSLSVKNLKTSEEFNINELSVRPSASTIKVFIMAEALRQVKEGKLSLKQRISVGQSERVPYSIIRLLDAETTYSIKDLITLMIIQSDNTATNVLIDMLGAENINAFIMSIGCEKTVIERKMMDFEARKKGLENRTCARDLSRFMELLYNGKLTDEESSKLMIYIMRHQLDTSMMRLFIPDDIKIAHKTGELDGIDHDTGIVYTENGDYVFTMMTYNAKSNNDARFAIGEVSKIVYDYFISK